jgi:hypothetical protein
MKLVYWVRDFSFIDRVVWNVKMAVNYELGKLRKYVIILKVLCQHLCGWHESLLGWLLGKGLNLGPVKYEAGMQSAALQHSLISYSIKKLCIYFLVKLLSLHKQYSLVIQGYRFTVSLYNWSSVLWFDTDPQANLFAGLPAVSQVELIL